MSGSAVNVAASMRLFFLFLLLTASGPGVAAAQNWGRVAGRVAEADSREPIPGVTILVAGTDFGTASAADGTYQFRLPEGRHVLRFSAVGFEPSVDTVYVVRERTARLDVLLRAETLELDEVRIEEQAGPAEAGVHVLDPEHVQNIPTPFKGFQALATMPGVAASNELSNQYSVHGGGFNENLIFINGFEVYMPFRPRQGEQEGLGLLNPDLAERITLYTGGFPARYGGKLSSALDVQYRTPDQRRIGGSASVSLLDASVATGATSLNGRLGWAAGLRKARARHFFSTQELKGDYQPDYTDVQAVASLRLAPGHEVEAIGIWADHAFSLDPQNRKTYFGIVSNHPSVPSNLQAIWINYGGEERDRYETRFAGVRLTDRLSSRWRAEHGVAYFGTVEHERFAIDGSAVLYQVNPQDGDPNSGAGHIPTGNVRQEDSADNRVAVSTVTGHGRYLFTTGRHAAEAGWHVRGLHFEDRIAEQAAVVGKTREGDVARVVVDSLNDAAVLDATQAGFYVQDAIDALPQSGRLVLTGGLRADYFSLNGEWTFSPRFSARYLASDRLTLNAAWGIYYQAPTYRELRGAPKPGETILGAINRDLKAQRSVQYVAGAEYFLPKQRLYLRGEAYYKALTNLISYTVENVRVLYSGENDARGHAYGLDLQLRGEFVPGLESWANYSYLNTAERFLPTFETPFNQGLVPRPTDQRHTFTVFVQDYVPGDPTWKLHLRGLFGSGLPYTPPVPGPRVGNIVTQIPGRRFSARYPEYRRIDMGVTKRLTLSDDARHPFNLEVTAELLNVFDMTNTVAYSWVPGGDGIWQRIPTRLTPRTFNLRARLAF